MTIVIARKNHRLNKQEQRFATWCDERGLVAVFDEITRLNGEVCLGLEWSIDGEIHSECYQVRLSDFPEVWTYWESVLRARRPANTSVAPCLTT